MTDTQGGSRYCDNCKHRERGFMLWIFPHYALCKASPTSDIDGKPAWSCEIYRRPNWPCGPEGNLFVPR